MEMITRLRTAMLEQGIQAMLLSDPVNIGWLTGFTGSFGRVIVTAEDAVLITDSRYTLQAAEQAPGIPLVSFATPKSGDGVVQEELFARGVTSVAFESSSTTVDSLQALQKKLGDIELTPAGEMLSLLRMTKSPAEVEKVRAACQLADACFDHVIRLIRPGMREIDVAIEIDFFFRKQGADSGFATIAVSGERSARPHGVPSDKELEEGDFLTMDFGARLDSYHSDITRTVVIGRASDRHKEVYAQVLKAQLASIDALKPGSLAKDVDGLARTILDEKGLAQYFGHGLGHGLGRLVHDGGRLGIGSETVIAPGQIWTIEPGVYIPGFGGVRIEDDVVVTAEGNEVLTRSTKELLELPLV